MKLVISIEDQEDLIEESINSDIFYIGGIWYDSDFNRYRIENKIINKSKDVIHIFVKPIDYEEII